MAGLPSSFPLKETSADEGLDSESEDEIDGENDEEENKDIEEESDPGDLDEIESLQETSARSSGSTTDEFVMVSLVNIYIIFKYHPCYISSSFIIYI